MWEKKEYLKTSFWEEVRRKENKNSVESAAGIGEGGGGPDKPIDDKVKQSEACLS